jgi:hypothetical protein
MEKIDYPTILKDKSIYLYMFELIEPVYKIHKKHTQVLEVQKWRTMLNKGKTEFTIDALIVLKNIMNDCANWLFVEGCYGSSEVAIGLMDNIFKLFKDYNDTKRNS